MDLALHLLLELLLPVGLILNLLLNLLLEARNHLVSSGLLMHQLLEQNIINSLETVSHLLGHRFK